MRAKTDPLPLFFSLKRFMDHEDCISAGSKEICRASFVLDVVGEEASSISVKRTVEGKLDLFLFLTPLTYRMSKIAGNMALRKLFSQV
jgi:hypothetical protein